MYPNRKKKIKNCGFPSHSHIVTYCINFKKSLYMLIMEQRNLSGIAR